MKILETLKQFSDLKQMFDGKIVAGDSAGANVLCEVFYSQKADGVFTGFGLLPLKIVCHFEEKYRDKLTNVRPELKTLFLSEYQFRVFDIG